MRCKGRIANADLPYETRFPALLPEDHHISTLLVRQAHERVHHSKVAATQAQLRMRFWIVRGRQFVKKITSRCTVCRRYEGRGFKVPPPPDLPEFRLSQKPAFTCVGVDYAGPLYIREPNCSTTKKVYILLFTCCSTRAVHQELATDLSADVFIRCLRRFTARRGLPEIIVSDKAKTFKSAPKALQKVFSYPSVKRFLANRRISWKFNMNRAPWWGGFFERMIQNVNLAPFYVRKNLAESLVIAKLDYASTVFYPLPQYQVDRIQRLQNACAGFVLRKYAGPEDLAYLNWLPISERRDFNILKLTHKAIHSSDFPEYLSLELRNVHTHNLRSSEAPLLLVPKETGTFQHSAASIFNKLPSALRNIKDYNSFCHSLKKYLSNRVK